MEHFPWSEGKKNNQSFIKGAPEMPKEKPTM
jgi:hypothetical protein